MQKLYYIRHGQSLANLNEIWSGAGNDTPLTDDGRAQAKHAGQQAKADGLKFDLIVCSPMDRAKETAKIVAAEIGYSQGDILIWPKLIERSFGQMEGQPWNDFWQTHPYKDTDSFKGAETVEQLQKRTETVLANLKDITVDNVLVVGHAAFGRALRRVINNEPYTNELEGELKQIPNAQIIKFI